MVLGHLENQLEKDKIKSIPYVYLNKFQIGQEI